MSDDDLIRRGDALAAIQLGDTVTKLQARIRAIPYVDADPVCTGCGGTGVTYQTERRCACQGPDLTDPVTVHANMLRGTIAKPTVEQIIHLYGRGAFQPMIDASIAKALEKACLAVSEHADWPEDEHGRTEQVGLFARVINAIRAITPAENAAAPNLKRIGTGIYETQPTPDHAAIREAWEKAYWRMRSYAVHDNDCKLNKPPHFNGPCSCGLTAVLEEALALISKGATEPTEYERKVAQMKKDFPNGI